MLAQIRAFAKSPFATLLLGLLVVSFGVWGIRDVFRAGGLSDAVVKAGGRPPVTSTQFKEIFTQAKAEREQQLGQPIPTEDAVKYGLDKGLVDEIAANEAFGALINGEGINPSDTLVAGELRKITAFFNPITGQFDKATYQRALAERHITEVEADAQFRDTVAQRHYIAALSAGLKAPRIYGLVQAAIQKEGRDFTWFTVEPRMVEQPAKPTDAQLNAFIKDNAAKLTKPEMRQISLVRFSAAALAQTLTAPPAEVQKRFDFEKDTLSVPEKRAVTEIPVKDAKTGAEIAAKLKAGGDPLSVAKAAGLQATTYPATPKAAIADKKVAEAAFAMKTGEVSGPIQGDLGLAVIKLGEITPAKPVTLNDVRAKIEGEVKQDLAKEKIYDVVQKYDDAHSGGAGIADAAKAAGQSVITLPPITQAGQALGGQRANLPPKVMQTAFTLPSGGESDVMDLGQGEYWVIHIDKIIPPTLFTLDEKVGAQTVREAITRQFVLDELTKRLRVKADALAAEVKQGKTIEAVAAEVGAKTTTASNVLASAGQAAQQGQPPAYSPELIGRLFQGKVGDVVAAQDTKPGFIVAKLTKIQEAPAPVLAGIGEALRPSIGRALFNDIGAATRLAAQKKVKPTVDYRRARSALGLDPDAAPAGPATPAGKQKS